MDSMTGGTATILLRVGAAAHFLRPFATALIAGTVFYVIIFRLERASGAPTDQNHGRSFLHDTFYWLYYRSGLNAVLFTAALFAFAAPKLRFLELTSVAALPIVLRTAVWLVVTDFTSYWVHRIQHAVPFVWAFHTTHHSQQKLNFATTTRFHPVDHFISDCLKFVPLLVLGASPLNWLPLYFTLDFIASTQHSQIAWRFGWLSKVIVTPRFHSFHHSARPDHYNKNFGALFSFWDYLFGTAVDAPEQPRAYGLIDTKMPTLWSTFVVPFQVLRRFYGTQPRANRPPIAANNASVNPH
jgi:sterol desaturase/sphingolipid hydroxylase (fatty acid hydroxylase superfamily)